MVLEKFKTACFQIVDENILNAAGPVDLLEMTLKIERIEKRIDEIAPNYPLNQYQISQCKQQVFDRVFSSQLNFS